MMFSAEFRESFWRRTQLRPNGCLEWSGGVFNHGYGQVWVSALKKLHLAHRVAYALVHGAFPRHDVCHKCDNRKCVRPEHLFEGTHSDNMRDMVVKGRGAGKLTPRQVWEARRRLSAGENQQSVGERLGVCQPVISNLHLGKTYQHVKGEV